MAYNNKNLICPLLSSKLKKVASIWKIFCKKNWSLDATTKLNIATFKDLSDAKFRGIYSLLRSVANATIQTIPYYNCLKGFLNIGISQLVVINCYETNRDYDNYWWSYIILSISLPIVIFWPNSLNHLDNEI